MEVIENIPVDLIIIVGGLLTGLIIRFLVIKAIQLGLRNHEHDNFRASLRKIRPSTYFFIPILIIFLSFTFYNSQTGFPVYQKVFQVLLIISGFWFLIRLVYAFEEIILRQFDVSKEDNIRERKIVTQLSFLKKFLIFLLCVVGLSAILLSFDEGRKFGTGLITSAGILSIIVGLAAQKTIANLLAGIQIAFTQPIRIDDVVIVEKEWGRIEEITMTYVVVKIWDLRRMIVPITYFIENPFQNWTRNDASVIGTVFLYADFRLPLDPLRKRLTEYLQTEPLWDGNTNVVQVNDTSENTMHIRALVSAKNSSEAFDLRCNVREMLIGFIRDHYIDYLPTTRVLLETPKNKE